MADRSTTRTIRARAGGDQAPPLWDDGPDVHPGWAPGADGSTAARSTAACSTADGWTADGWTADRSAVLIDCETCAVRGPGCADCVMTVLLGMPAPPVRLGADQVVALEVLAGSGLVPPLRHGRVG